MPKRHVITIAGRPGSGKSSTAKRLAATLDMKHFSSGDLFRALAKERGIDVLQANLSAEENEVLDHLVDGKLREIGQTEDSVVIDSRTAWHWMPDSFKVFLDLDLMIAAERILSQKDESRHHSEHVHDDIEEYANNLQRRLDSESKRYRALYDIDPYNISNYDLVINTESQDLKTVTNLILDSYRSWLRH